MSHKVFLSYPLNSLLVETNFQNFEENCVIFNAEFDQGLEDLVRKSFDLDELGLKDQVRTSGLGFAKIATKTGNFPLGGKGLKLDGR